MSRRYPSHEPTILSPHSNPTGHLGLHGAGLSVGPRGLHGEVSVWLEPKGRTLPLAKFGDIAILVTSLSGGARG
jgi:hypothetical protein